MTFGRCTFIAMLWPFFSLASWTCAMLADAIGFLLNKEQVSSIVLFHSDSIISFASLKEKGWTLSCSLRNSSLYSDGIKSGLTLSNWPSLINVGPSFSSVLLK